MRVENSLRNISASMVSQVIIIILGFLSRKIFLDNLGTEYLGINGLLTNVLSMLGLVESGIGVSIIYNLYKPLAENDEKKVASLVQLYKKTYGILAIIVLMLSLLIYPLVLKIMKGNESNSYITVIYFIFVIRNIISYLYAHKWSLINADQKGYVLARINIVFNVMTLLMRIIILNITKSYILYLIVEILILVFQNIFNGNIVDKRYPYIKSNKKYEIDIETKNNIVKNVKALFLHNIGSYCVLGTDNILISAFVNVATVGLYSNYTMIIGQLSGLVSPILGGISASVGNLIATEGHTKSYKVFKVSYLVNFWIYSFCTIFLFNLMEPFIEWWLGDGLLLDKPTFIVILINFYIMGMRLSIMTFKTKAGIFVQDKYMPLLEAIINLGISIILAEKLGIIGIFLGTTISTLSIVFWNVPRLVYKNIFKVSVKDYFMKYAKYVLITLLSGTITTYICNFINSGDFLSLVLKGVICVIIYNLILVLLFFKTEEFQYLYCIIKKDILKINNNLEKSY